MLVTPDIICWTMIEVLLLIFVAATAGPWHDAVERLADNCTIVNCHYEALPLRNVFGVPPAVAVRPAYCRPRNLYRLPRVLASMSELEANQGNHTVFHL